MRIKFKFNSQYKYDVDVTPSRVAVWEYSRINGDGIFNLYDKDQFVSKGSSLSKKLRFESLHNNLQE